MPRYRTGLAAALAMCALFVTFCTSPTETEDPTAHLPVRTLQVVEQSGQMGVVAAGDDSLYLYVNGELLGVTEGGGNPHFFPFEFSPGHHVIAAHVANPFLGGSLIAYVGYPVVRYLIDTTGTVVDSAIGYRSAADIATGGDWDYSVVPTQGWQDVGFTGDWRTPHIVGAMEEAVQGDTHEKMHEKGWDTTSGAAFIFLAPSTYYRRAFTAAADGIMTLKLSHRDGRVDSSEIVLYLNGEALTLKEFSPRSITLVCTTQITAGEHLFAAELHDLSPGNGSKWILEAIINGTDTVKTDSTWKVWDVAVAGWNESGFDDGEWLAASMMGVDHVISMQWGAWVGDIQFANIWQRRDTTVTKVTKYVVHDTLNWQTFEMDTVRIDTIPDFDSLTIKRYGSSARWLFPPKDVYFRYEFMLEQE